MSGEQKSTDTESADEFIDNFQKFVEENKVSAEWIYNADETGLLWRCLPSSTLVCRMKQVLSKGQDEEQKEDEDEDDNDTKIVMWNEGDEGLRTFIKFARQW